MTSRKGRCCVADCPTTNMEGVTHFSLPIDIDRRLNWLKAIGRPDMTTRDDLKPKNHVVCSIHFDEQQMTTLKQTLQDAVPTRCVPRIVKGVFKTLSSVRTQTDFSSDSDSYDSDNEENNRKHFDEEDDYNGKRLKIDEDIDEVLDSPADNAPVAPPNIDFENWNKFFEWKDRTTSRRRGTKFDKDFSLFALNLHSINSRAYKLLMQTWQLPTEKELKAVELKIGPRFDDLMMSLLSQKFNSLSKRGRFCALGFYTLKLKPHVYYDADSDDVIGIHNVNGNRTKKVASYALMAMVKGIKSNWSQLLTFSFLSTMTDVDSIDSFIANALARLKKMKMTVLALVMPDDECFETYCKNKKCMTVAKPFVFFDRERLHVVFDVPHLLNRLRDDFITNDLIYKGKTVSWEYIKEVYILIKENGGRLLPKLTGKHLEPDKTDKGLKYPCQIFSQSVASAIYFYANHTVMAAQAENTAEFISKMNEVFDSLNSNKMDASDDTDDLTTEIKHGIRASVQYKALEDGLDLFNNLKPVRNRENATRELKTIEYFQVSLKSLMNVAEDLQRANQIGVTHTTLFYLDPIFKLVEEFKRDAKSEIPMAIQFSRTFSRLFVENLVEITTPPASIDNMANFLKMADEIKDVPIPDPAEHIRLTDTDYTLQLPDECPLVYLSSYLLYKCAKFHGCKDLISHYKTLIDLNKSKLKVHFKGLNKEAEFVPYLKSPSDAFTGYVGRLDDCFLEKFDDFYKNNPAVAMHEPLKYVRQCVWPCSCFPKEYLLKLFVRARIFETVEYNVKCLEEKWITQFLFHYERSFELKVRKL